MSASLASLTVAVLCTTAVNTLWIFYVVDVARLTATAYGLTSAAWSLGIVLAAFWVPRLLPQRLHATALGVSTLTLGGSVVAATLVGSVGRLVPVTLVCGVCNGVQNIVIRAMICDRVPEPTRGTAFALMGACLSSGNVAGMLAGAAIAGLLGVPDALRLSGFLTAVAGAVLVVVVARSLRRRSWMPTSLSIDVNQITEKARW